MDANWNRDIVPVRRGIGRTAHCDDPRDRPSRQPGDRERVLHREHKSAVSQRARRRPRALLTHCRGRRRSRHRGIPDVQETKAATAAASVTTGLGSSTWMVVLALRARIRTDARSRPRLDREVQSLPRKVKCPPRRGRAWLGEHSGRLAHPRREIRLIFRGSTWSRHGSGRTHPYSLGIRSESAGFEDLHRGRLLLVKRLSPLSLGLNRAVRRLGRRRTIIKTSTRDHGPRLVLAEEDDAALAVGIAIAALAAAVIIAALLSKPQAGTQTPEELRAQLTR